MFVILCVLHFANSLPVIAAEETWQPRNRCQWSCDSDGNNRLVVITGVFVYFSLVIASRIVCDKPKLSDWYMNVLHKIQLATAIMT